MHRIIGWSLLGWLLVLPCAIANGALREIVLVPRWGVPVAQLLSGVLLLMIITGIVAWMVQRVGSQRVRVFLAIGLGWLIATAVFEFTLGVRAGKTLDEICAAYRFTNYSLWSVVMGWIALAPLVMAWWRGLLHHDHPSTPSAGT